MVTVVLKHDGEDNVIKLTYENLWRELKDIPGAEIIVSKNWFDDLDQVKNKFVCFMEADCLVSSGYFDSLLALLLKNSHDRHVAVMASAIAVNIWANRFFGYDIHSIHVDGLIPIRERKSSSPYAVEVAYLPGALIRMSALKKLVKDHKKASIWEENLVHLSANISLNIWGRNMAGSEEHVRRPMMGSMVYLNPNTTYVTTEDYVNDIAKFKPEVENLEQLTKIFRQQSI